jgi:hypothetical protein
MSASTELRLLLATRLPALLALDAIMPLPHHSSGGSPSPFNWFPCSFCLLVAGHCPRVLDGVRCNHLPTDKSLTTVLVLSKGKRYLAWRNIQRLNHDPQDPEDTFARKEFYQMTQQYALELQRRSKMNNVHWWDFFKKASFRKRLVVCMGAQLINVSTGNLVMNRMLSSSHQMRTN